jgi:hypothetical protein
MSQPDISERLSKLETELAVLVAKDEIRTVFAKYCRGLDRRNRDLVANCFHADSCLNFGLYKGDGDGWADLAIDGVDRYFEGNSFYFLGQSSIVVGGETALAETYIFSPKTMKVRSSEGEVEMWMGGGRFIDKLERRLGEWRILNRTFVADWDAFVAKSHKDKLPEPWDVVAEKAEIGQKNSSDFSYRAGFTI